MSYQLIPPPSNLEVSAYKFIEELQEVRIKAKLLHPSDIQLAKNIIISVRKAMSCVQKEMKEFEVKFQKNNTNQAPPPRS